MNFNTRNYFVGKQNYFVNFVSEFGVWVWVDLSLPMEDLNFIPNLLRLAIQSNNHSRSRD